MCFTGLPQRSKSVQHSSSSGTYGPLGFKAASEPRSVLSHQLRGLGRVTAPTTSESTSKTDEDKLAEGQADGNHSNSADSDTTSRKNNEPVEVYL